MKFKIGSLIQLIFFFLIFIVGISIIVILSMNYSDQRIEEIRGSILFLGIGLGLAGLIVCFETIFSDSWYYVKEKITDPKKYELLRFKNGSLVNIEDSAKWFEGIIKGKISYIVLHKYFNIKKELIETRIKFVKWSKG